MKLTEQDKQVIRAIARDRQGIDRRLMEIDAEIQHLMDERSRLKSERLTNMDLAEKFEVSHTLIQYVLNGRFQ